MGDFSRPNDTVLLGPCDEIVEELCRELGWRDQLQKLWAATELKTGKSITVPDKAPEKPLPTVPQEPSRPASADKEDKEKAIEDARRELIQLTTQLGRVQISSDLVSERSSSRSPPRSPRSAVSPIDSVESDLPRTFSPEEKGLVIEDAKQSLARLKRLSQNLSSSPSPRRESTSGRPRANRNSVASSARSNSASPKADGKI